MKTKIIVLGVIVGFVILNIVLIVIASLKRRKEFGLPHSNFLVDEDGDLIEEAQNEFS